MGGEPTRTPTEGQHVTRNVFEDWIPEEWDSAVITRIKQMSVVEAYALTATMTTDTRHIPRSGGVEVEGVSKGSPYGEDTSLNDDVLLTARKMGTAIRIADEDLTDSPVAIIAQKQLDWATSYAKFLDNACLGCTGTENGTTVLFTSVYKSLRTTNADTAYTANDNYTATGSGGPTYDLLSDTVGKVETSDYWADDEIAVIAHPTYRKSLRGIKDGNNRPIFITGLAGTPDTLFEIPIRWSLGARTSAVGTQSPAGKPLLIAGNVRMLKLGLRSGPESRLATADSGVGFLTDEALLKMRSRRGFTIGHERAFSILEDTR
jgi:HK97 family phage major capsid protein